MVVVGLGVLVLLFVLADTRALLRTIEQINPWLLILPVLATLGSYLAMSKSYQGIAHAADCPFPFWEMLKISFVANSMNYMVATGGLSGFAARLYFFTRRGISGSTATSISLAQGFITNVTLLLFILIGFGYLIASARLSPAALVTTSILLGLCVAATIICIVFLFRRRLRRRVIFVLSQTADRLLHRFLPRYKPARTRIWRFQRNLNLGIDFLLDRRTHMIAPTIWILIDWLLTMGILEFAFLCVGYPISFSVLIIGFALGLTLSLISIIPAGLGVMEGSMAAVFTSLDVPFETAVVAVLIFRVAFHVIPLVTSVFFFHGLFVEGRAHSGEG